MSEPGESPGGHDTPDNVTRFPQPSGNASDRASGSAIGLNYGLGTHLAPGAFALVAMGAVFGAASRATFTFIILPSRSRATTTRCCRSCWCA